MEAAAPLPKKRKSGVPGSRESGEISSREPAAAATEAADSHILPGAGAEEGVDHISGLPDAVLGDIISLLPTREGARTQTLASRWRHLWRSAPLNLDYDDLPAEGDVLIALISRILSAHAGSGRRLCISANHLCHHPATVDAWLRSTALSNLQELEFCCAADHPWVLPTAAASSISRLSSSLRVATISQCRLPDGISETLHFPQLKLLTLEEVSISEGSLYRVIAGCPVLESMLLNRSTGFNCVRISSPTLRTIGVRVGDPIEGEPHFWKIIIEDAPCLEKLLQLDFRRLDISIISAPNLEIMGYLSYLDIYFFDFQRSRAVFPTVVHTIKTLSIIVDANSVVMVLSFMSCFPCLEKLYIEQFGRAEKTPWRRKHKSHIKSLDIRLKTIVLINYRGVMSDVNFAMFFVLHAKMLELFRFKVRGFLCNDFIAQQRRLLQLGKRASRVARFEFTKKTTYRRKLEGIKRAQDLSVADPFEY